jgi:purine-binding chemotaxis protein CheW
MPAEPEQYLTFVLGDEEYAIDISNVQEIKGYSAITTIPNAPAYVRGVMNLRGTVIPVVDLRARFGMPVKDYTKFTVIIIVTIADRIYGLVVDAVSDVLNLAGADLEPPPELGDALDTSFMTGIARNGDRLITVLQVDRALGIAGSSVS